MYVKVSVSLSLLVLFPPFKTILVLYSRACMYIITISIIIINLANTYIQLLSFTHTDHTGTQVEKLHTAQAH